MAAAIGVGPSTASEHLAVLVEAGLLLVRPSGRQRRYALAGRDVAQALEALGRLAPDDAQREVRSLRQSREQRELAGARLCYDHLAGRLGVALTDALVADRWLTGGDLRLTRLGRSGFGDLGVDVPALEAARRPLTRSCDDWTERRPHLAGALGAALATTALDRGWVRRRATGRGLDVTPAGHRALVRTWSVALD
nr:helix-turn-helix domain-containing protein [Angustibacter aerolatus]